MTELALYRPEPCVLVIFGASGDLTHRKLVPALYHLFRQKLLPECFRVLGASRSSLSDDDFRSRMREALAREIPKAEEGLVEEFLLLLNYHALNTSDVNDYAGLKTRIEALESCVGTTNRIYYLATPPELYGKIPLFLAEHNMHDESTGWKRLIVEKPFGKNLDSALDLNKKLQGCFNEKQIYRIDHYLGKETVQNLLMLRFANQIFEPLWNKNHIRYVEVTAAEFIGVEKRGGYYDQSGAVRDMIQNHLLQLLAMVTMEAPSKLDARSVRDETYKVLEALRPIQNVAKDVVFGQYTESHVRGDLVNCYRKEEGVPADSRTETFSAMRVFIDNSRWQGVPFYLRTGKRMPTRVSEVVIHFHKTPHPAFGEFSGNVQKNNQLVIRIHPDEGVLLKVNMKVPGRGFESEIMKMDFLYSESGGDQHLPEAYERLLHDCMLGDATLFARGDAVESCWNFIDPILCQMKSQPIYGYPAGSWGPKEAEELVARNGHHWRYPCKNLADDGEYCSL